MWFIGAERFFSEVIASHAVGTGAAAAAQFLEFAGSAFAAQQINVAQFSEQFGVFPDVLEPLLAHVACFHR